MEKRECQNCKKEFVIEPDDFSFYENFNTQTQEPNGVAFCAWSAAAGILAHQSIYHNFKFLI